MLTTRLIKCLLLCSVVLCCICCKKKLTEEEQVLHEFFITLNTQQLSTPEVIQFNNMISNGFPEDSLQQISHTLTQMDKAMQQYDNYIGMYAIGKGNVYYTPGFKDWKMETYYHKNLNYYDNYIYEYNTLITPKAQIPDVVCCTLVVSYYHPIRIYYFFKAPKHYKLPEPNRKYEITYFASENNFQEHLLR